MNGETYLPTWKKRVEMVSTAPTSPARPSTRMVSAAEPTMTVGPIHSHCDKKPPWYTRSASTDILTAAHPPPTRPKQAYDRPPASKQPVSLLAPPQRPLALAAAPSLTYIVTMDPVLCLRRASGARLRLLS